MYTRMLEQQAKELFASFSPVLWRAVGARAKRRRTACVGVWLAAVIGSGTDQVTMCEHTEKALGKVLETTRVTPCPVPVLAVSTCFEALNTALCSAIPVPICLDRPSAERSARTHHQLKDRSDG